MIAKYDSHCYLCCGPILVGQEIERNNAERRHRSYVHSSCNPVAGIYSRAGYRVEIVQADDKGYIAAGRVGQYVRKVTAEARAQSLRDLGAKNVVVVAL